MRLRIIKLQQCSNLTVRKKSYFHPTLYSACDYLSKLELRLIHAGKRGSRTLPVEATAWSMVCLGKEKNAWFFFTQGSGNAARAVMMFHHHVKATRPFQVGWCIWSEVVGPLDSFCPIILFVSQKPEWIPLPNLLFLLRAISIENS